MLISKREVEKYLSREFESYLWMKKLTKGQLLRELAGLRVTPKFKTDPWLHQLVCFLIGLTEPRFLFLLDMGLGKSKIVLDLISYRQRQLRLDRALVLVPRVINIDSWGDDIARHSNLEPILINVENIEAKREYLLNPKGGDLSVIDYSGLQWALCDKKKGKLVRNDKLVRMAHRLYNFVALDESHKLKNHESLWFSTVHQLVKEAEFVYATTGTLFGRNVEDLWSQFKLVDGGETFGEYLGLFRGAFFTQKTNPWKGVTYHYNQRRGRELYKMLQHRSIRYDDDEINDLPPRVYRKIRIDMSPEQREHYLRAVEGVINSGGDRRLLDAPWLRMRQITSGYLKWKDDHGDHMIKFKQNPKLDALDRVLDESGDSKLVVCYDYTETGAMICNHLKSAKVPHVWLYGGTKDRGAVRRKFLDDPECKVMVMNSEAGGTGNDGLQRVARYMLFFESPTPVITRKQTEKRIHRSGMTGRCFIYDLVLRGTVDNGILKAIEEGKDLHDGIMSKSEKEKRGVLLGGPECSPSSSRFGSPRPSAASLSGAAAKWSASCSTSSATR